MFLREAATSSNLPGTRSMPRLIHPHANNGTLAGCGLLSVIASVLLALSLATTEVSGSKPVGPALRPVLQALLGAIRVGG